MEYWIQFHNSQRSEIVYTVQDYNILYPRCLNFTPFPYHHSHLFNSTDSSSILTANYVCMYILQHKYRYCMQIKASPSKALGNWQALREMEDEQEVNVENEQDVCVCVNFPNDIILCISWLRCLFVYLVVCCCCSLTHIGCFDQTVRRQQ